MQNLLNSQVETQKRFDMLDMFLKNNQITNKNTEPEQSEGDNEEYNPENIDPRYICEACNCQMLIKGFQTQCLQCGLIGENHDFAQQYGNYNSCSYNIKTLEQKDAELRFNYAMLSSDCERFLKQQNLSDEVIEALMSQAIQRLRKLEKTNPVIMTKLFVSLLYEVSAEMKLQIPKKTIYTHFNVNVSNHSQYIKKAHQIKMQYSQMPEENKMNVGAKLDTYDLYQIMFAKLQKYSSSANMVVINLIADFIGFSGTQPNLKNTTNSIVVEYPQIASLWICNYQKWKDLIAQGLPKSLIEMRSKQFNIDFTQSPPFFSKIKSSDKSVMNTAVNLQVKGLASNKTYTLKIFSKGKVVIAGVTTPYEQSEVSILVQDLFRSIFKLVGIPYSQPSIIKTTLSNFSSYVPIGQGNLIDISQAEVNLTKSESLIQDLCNANNTYMVGHKVINHRIYLDLTIQKKEMPFYIHNTESTSNLKSHRSVQFILTQKGILIIQGADDNLINTVHVRKVFGLIFEAFIQPFVYGASIKQNDNEAVIDMNELNQLLTSLKDKITSTYQKELITNTWTYFQRHHILAEHSLRVKTRYFAQIIDIASLVSLNEQDIHNESHDFNPLSYIINTEHPFKVPSVKLVKTNTLDICFKCIMLRKKENAIQTPGLLTFLKEVVKVPELTSNFVQLLNSIIGSITKTTKKNKHQSKI